MPGEVTVDDRADFRQRCHANLPAAQAEWIDEVPFAAVRVEAQRQARRGRVPRPRGGLSGHVVRLPAVEIGLVVIMVAFALALLLLVFWW